MYLSRFSILVSLAVVISLSADAQVYTTGREDGKSEIDFTEIANYYKAHPEPLVRKPLFDEDDDEEDNRPEPAEPDASMVHLINRSAASRLISGSGPAMLPVSPSPSDTFESTISDGSGIPPDTHGEVNENYCVTAINTAIHIQTKTGGFATAQVTLDQFWLSMLSHGGGSFDPRVHYDPHYKRWIMVGDAYGQTTYSQIMIAVSKTSNPTSGWYMYKVATDPSGQSWLDYPNVGFNGKWVTVTGNYFQNTSGTGATGAVVYVFDYVSMMNGAGAPYTKITENTEFCLAPALTYDTTEQNMFMLEVSSGNSGKLQLWKISGPVGSPVITSVGFPATTTHWKNGGSNDFVPQLGTTHKLQSGDNRIHHVVQRNNHLWTSHTVWLPATGTATRCSSMWWEIDTLGNPMQNGLIDNSTGPQFFDYASIAVNANDDALIGYTHCSSTMYPAAAYRLHLHTDPADSMRPEVIFRHGQANYYETFGGTQNRWGDYSSTCVDPINNCDFWTIQETVPATPANYWDTWWAHLVMCSVKSSYAISKDTIQKAFNDTLTFNGTAPTGSTYVWNFGGGTATPGTGAGPQHVKWNAGGWQKVILYVTDSGCTSTFTDSVFVKANVGINGLNTVAPDITVVPNPNDGTFYIVSGTVWNKPTEVKITDMQGRLVFTKKYEPVNSSSIPVNASNLTAGNYVLTISIDGSEVTRKITISK
jgi:hypothetical protein